jgi:hypothetical protein
MPTPVETEIETAPVASDVTDSFHPAGIVPSEPFEVPPVDAPPSAWLRVARMLGVDRAIAFTVLARGWASTAGLVTVALIARTLSPAEQGYYYTFGSMVAMQLIFELGFSVVILQLASHEAAHLKFHDDGSITGDARTHGRLASVLRKSVHWYTIAAVAMGVFLLPAGWFFFTRHADPAHPVAWHWPWALVVVFSCLTFQIDPVFSFLEGCGFIARVARTRLAQALAGSTLAWLALITHHGLFAPAMMVSGQAVAGFAWLYRRRALLVGLYRHVIGSFHIDWWAEVWPFQWRIAVSYGCGFFIFQLFNPVLFAYWGAAAAGRMGMSISLSNALASIAIAWINTKSAPFGAMIARRSYAELDRVFFRAAAQSLALSLLGSACVWTLALVLEAHGVKLAQRLLPPLPLGLLLLSMNINQAVSSMAIYLRAHKQEKFLLNSIVGAICISLSTFFLGRRYGALGITAGQFCIAVIVGLGLGGYTFMKYRRLWHDV